MELRELKSLEEFYCKVFHGINVQVLWDKKYLIYLRSRDFDKAT